MRRSALLLVLLLVPLAPGQSDEAAALAPLQTVVDAAPGIVDAALLEARLDGTPSLAQDRVDTLLAFVAGLEGQQVPPGSAAARERLGQKIPWAVDLASALSVVPQDLADIETGLADCQSLTGSREHAAQRIQAGVNGGRGLSASRAALDDLRVRAPDGVDARPLAKALDTLDEALADSEDALACFLEWEELLNLTELPDYIPIDDPFLFLRVVPATQWPTGTVRLLGATGGEAMIRITAPGILEDVDVEANRTFLVNATVLRSAPLGFAEVIATTGGLVANDTLEVVVAPASMQLTGPARVVEGESFTMTASIASPIPVRGAIRFEPGGEQASAGGEASVRLELEPGTHVVTASHPGHRYQEATQASWQIIVVAEQDAARQEGGVAGGATGPGGSVDWDSFGILLALLALALLIVSLRNVRFRRRRLPPVPDAVPEPVELPRGFMATVAAIMGWLRQAGRARPGTTVREAAEGNPEMQPAVEPFERARYGRGGHEREPGVLERLLRFWRRP